MRKRPPRFCLNMPKCMPCFLPRQPIRPRKLFRNLLHSRSLSPRELADGAVVMGLI